MIQTIRLNFEVNQLDNEVIHEMKDVNVEQS